MLPICDRPRKTAAVKKRRAVRVAMTPKLHEARAMALGLMARCGLSAWVFRFNRRKRDLGMCFYPSAILGEPGRIELSVHFVEKNGMEEVRDTVLHEVAHALCPPGTGHGPAWVEMCETVGARPQRCGRAEMPAGKWRGECPGCGEKFARHRRPRSPFYACNRCGPERGTFSYRKVG